MGDLAQRRSARDLWISRSHLWAAGTVGLLAVVVAFLAGLQVGRGEQEAPKRAAYTANAGGEELVEVLARVDANERTDNGVHALTFPDALTAPVEGDPPPPGRYTVEVGRFGGMEAARPLREHLRGAGLPAWVGVERVDGEPIYRVSVGGYARKDDAEGALERIQGALEPYVGSAGVPFVRDRQAE